MRRKKTMMGCILSGKICCKVRSNYNGLVYIQSSLSAIKNGEHTDNIVYEGVHQAILDVENKLMQKILKTCLKCENKQKTERAKAEVEAAKQAVEVAKQAVREAVGANNRAYNIASERAFESITDEELECLDDNAIIDLGLDAAFADELYIATEKVVFIAREALEMAEKDLEDKMLVLMSVSGSAVGL